MESWREKMDPVTAVVIAVVAALGVGFGAGWGLKPDAGAKAIEAQTEVIEALQTGNTQLVTEVQRVALEEAQRDVKIAEKLTNVPPQCIREMGGDPMSIDCAWAWCVRTGESDRQRCESSKLVDELIAKHRKSMLDQ
jgi:hypothetical protein